VGVIYGRPVEPDYYTAAICAKRGHVETAVIELRSDPIPQEAGGGERLQPRHDVCILITARAPRIHTTWASHLA
jgi:hypothetical protein